MPCAAGSYYEVSDATCYPCPQGYYQVLRMQATCDKCPEGTSTFNNTEITGATFCLGMSPLQFAIMLFNPKENSGSYKLYLCSCEPNIDLHDIHKD